MTGVLIDIRIAFRNLVEHRRRTAFLGAAIAIVTALFVLLTSLSSGIRDAIIEAATTLTTGHLNVGGFFKVTADEAVPIVTDYEVVSELVRNKLPGVDSIVQRGRGYGRVVSDDGTSVPAIMSGIDIAEESQFQRVIKLASGNVAELAQPNTILLFELEAKKLGVRVGDTVTVTAATATGVANSIDCRVVAIARELGIMSRLSVYVSNASLRDLYQFRADTTGVLQIQLKPAYLDRLDSIAGRLRALLSDAGYRVMEPDQRTYYLKNDAVMREEWTGQKLDVTTWEDEVSIMLWPLQALRALSAMLLLVLLVIMAAGVMNALWIAIRERTREIGTLRAIGMQRLGVARLFLCEAAMLGLFGATLGSLLGASLTVLVNSARLPVPLTVQIVLMRNTLYLALEPRTLLATVVGFTLITSAAALFPSLRAARRKPVDAMGHFG